MAEINSETQQELRNEISQEFMHLAAYLKHAGEEFGYNKIYQLNSKFEEYAGNNVLLLTKPEEVIPL